CARDAIPITVRGSGTGNYGQSIPLHGGDILDMSGYNAFGWVRGGAGRAQAGIRLADFDRQARPQGWELRWLPPNSPPSVALRNVDGSQRSSQPCGRAWRTV